jgi:hypothetical protein
LFWNRRRFALALIHSVPDMSGWLASSLPVVVMAKRTTSKQITGAVSVDFIKVDGVKIFIPW